MKCWSIERVKKKKKGVILLLNVAPFPNWRLPTSPSLVCCWLLLMASAKLSSPSPSVLLPQSLLLQTAPPVLDWRQRLACRGTYTSGPSVSWHTHQIFGSASAVTAAVPLPAPPHFGEIGTTTVTASSVHDSIYTHHRAPRMRAARMRRRHRRFAACVQCL